MIATPSKTAVASPHPIWYSKMARQLALLMANQEPAATLRGKVDGWAKAGKFSADELRASGLTDWLDSQSGRITKEQVVDFVETHGVTLTETMLGLGISARDMAELERAAELEYAAPFDELADFQQQRICEELSISLHGEGRTKYGNWRLPGGEDYRELLITLPPTTRGHKLVVRPVFDGDAGKYWEVFNETTNEFEGTYDSESEAQSAADQANADLVNEPVGYQSSHWGMVNIVVHIRFDTRVDANGKPVCFVHEIQSDWAQSGRKYGFQRPDSSDAELHQMLNDAGYDANYNGTNWVVSSKDGGPVPNKLAGGTSRNQFAGNLAQVTQMVLGRDDLRSDSRAVPAAPFVTSTDAWVALAVKRMIRYAADNGFDRIVWATGAQLDSIFTLSSEVDSIEWFKDDAVGKYTFYAYHGTTVATAKHGLTIREVGENIGIHLAREIESSTRTSGELSGAALKVGSGGMNAFYDSLLPSIVNNTIKKLGGGRVAESSVKTGAPYKGKHLRIGSDGNTFWVEESSPEAVRRSKTFDTWIQADDERLQIFNDEKTGCTRQLGFEISPEMRASAQQGFPMFGAAELQPATASIFPSPDHEAWGRLVYKGVEIDFVRGDGCLSVFEIHSSNRLKGEAREALKLLKAKVGTITTECVTPDDAGAIAFWTRMVEDGVVEQATTMYGMPLGVEECAP
jgi:hypothetical protein